MDEDLKLDHHLSFVILLLCISIPSYLCLDISSDIFGVIATSLAAILAIVFSISILTIQIVVEKYNPTVLSYFKKSKLTKLTLLSFIVSIVSSIVIYGMKDCNQGLCAIGFGVFVVSLYVFYQFFNMMLKIIDPKNLGILLKEWCCELISLRNQNLSKDVVLSMGEIAIKSLQQKENSTTKHYLDYIDSIFWGISTKVPKNYNRYGNNLEFEISKALLEQYENISGEAIHLENNETIRNISDRLYNISQLKKITQNESISIEILSTGYNITKFAVDKQISSRFDIVYKFLKIYSALVSDPEISENNIFLKHYFNYLFHTNRHIIDSNDFELFREEIDHLSYSNLCHPPSAQNDLKNALYLHETSFLIPEILASDGNKSKEYSKKIDQLHYQIQFNLPIAFNKPEKFEAKLKEFIDFVYSCISEEDKEEFFKAKTSIKGYYKTYMFNAYINKIFFLKGSHLIYAQEKFQRSYVKFIFELWYHTRPNGARSRTYVLNETPVSFDPLWLTQLYLYGGDKSSLWKDMSVHYDGYVDFSIYISKYYLICLCKCVELNKTIILPSSKDIDEYARKSENNILEKWYSLLNNIHHEINLLKPLLKELIDDSATYDILFNGDAFGALTKTNEYLEQLQENCSGILLQTERKLPIDEKKKNEFIKNILNGYNQSKTIEPHIKTERYNKSNHLDLKFSPLEISDLIDRDVFIRLSNHIIISETEYGRLMALIEIEHLLRTIFENDSIEKIICEKEGELLYNIIKDTCKKMMENRTSPHLVFIHKDLKKMLPKETKDRFSKNLIIDEETQLKMIISPPKSPFIDNIVILDSSAINCISKTFNDDEIWNISIEEDCEDKSKLNIKITSEVSCIVNNTDKVKIIQIRS